MKSLLLRYKKFLTCIGILTPFVVATAGQKATIRIATQDNQPYEAMVKGKEVGLFVDIVDGAFKKAGVTVIYETYPWKRAYQLAKRGTVDATMPWYRTPEREKDFIYSDLVTLTTNKFFILKKGPISQDFPWRSLSDFRRFRLGGVDGYWYQDALKRNRVRVDLADTDVVNLKKLHSGRIDTFIADEIIGRRLIQELFPNSISDFSTIDKPESEAGSFLIASRGNRKSGRLIAVFNNGLKEMRRSGEYDAILRKYGVNGSSPFRK